MNKKFFLWIIGLAALLVLIITTGWEDTLLIWQGVNTKALIILLLGLASLQVCTLALSTYQWYYLLNHSFHNNISFAKVFSIFLAGTFVEYITPSSKLGGEATKIYLLKKKTGMNYNDLTTSLLAYKYVSLIPFVFICLLSLILASFYIILPLIVYLSFGILFFIMCIFVWLIHRKTKKIKPKNTSYLKQPSESNGFLYKIIKKCKFGIGFIQDASSKVEINVSKKQRSWLFFISFLIWGLYPIKIYIVSVFLGFQISLVLVVIATYSAYLISMLPVSPGGLGTFEGSLAFILSINGFLFSQGMAIALLTRVITFWFPLLLSTLAIIHLMYIKGTNVFSDKELLNTD